MAILGEFKKMHRTGVYAIMLILCIFPVVFQGLLGVYSDFDGDALFITSLGIFCRIFIVIAIGLLVSFSFNNEFKKNGYLNSIYHGISHKKALRNKLFFFYIMLIVYFIVSLMLSGVIITVAGTNFFSVLIDQIQPIFYLNLCGFLLINIHFIICLMAKQASLISLLVAFMGAIASIFVPATPYWVWFPWSYPYRVLYFTSLEPVHLVLFVTLTIISFLVVLVLIRAER